MARKSKNLPTYNPQDFVAGFDSFDLSQFVGTGQPTAQAAKPQAQGEGGESPGIMKDMEYSLAAGIDDLGATGFYGLEKAAEFAGIDWLTNLARSGREYFNTRAEGQRKAMSPEMRAARQKKFVEEDAEGTITGFGSAWGDPRAILGTVAESAPSMIASLAPSAVMAKGLMNLGLSRGLAWAIGSGVGEGGVGGLQNSKDVYEQVMAMDEAKLQDSPEYQAYRVTMDPDDAKRALANDIALKVFGTTGAATAVLGAPMGMVFGRALGGETGKTLARTMGKQAIGEALEETGQSGAETYLSQLELQRADTSINPMSGVANAAVAGGIAGGFMGGGMGAPAHFIGRRRAADNLIRDAENDNPEPGQPGGPTVPPEQAVNPGSAGEVFSGPEWNAPEVRPDLDAEWNRQARERGWDHLSSEKPVQPYVSPDAFLSQQEMDDIEAFVRAFEERERMQDDIDALTEYGQRKQTSPVQAALSSGQAVDLLALPAGNAAMPMGTNAPSGPAIATPTDYAGTPIATPYIPRPALPSDTGGQNYVGQWTGGASQLSYPYGDMAQGVTGGLMPQTIDITASPASAAPTVEQVAPDDLTPYQRQMLMLAEQEATPSAPSLAPTQTPALPQSGALPVWAQQEAAREREREAQRQEQAAEEERRHQELLARIPEGQREKVADWPLERLENALEQYDAEMLAERMEVEIANGNAAIGDTLRAFYRDELLAGRKVTKAMARAKAREVIQRDGLTVTPEDMRIQIGKALWEGGDEALEAEAAKGGDNLVERLHSILENLPKDIKKSYLTRLRFKAGSLAKAAQERDAEGGQDGIQAGPEEKPVQQQTELERRKEIMRDLAAAYDWDKMKRMPTSKLEELHADYMAQKRKPAERAPEGATDKDGAYIKHDGWWYTKGSDGQAKDRLGVSYQDRLESEWRAAQGNDSAQPSPAPAEEQPQAAAAPERSYGTPDAPDTIALADHFAEQFMQGKRYKTILEARREVGRLLGGTAIPKGQALKTVDEAIELGVVQAARKTAADMRADGKSDVEIFRAMVDLYERQPNLGTRTSTSVAEQAYSTPVPLSFLASRLARIGKNSRVYEPTAGNGSLLIEVSPGNATVNELNGGRAERLRSQGFTVTQKDAAQYAPDGKVDVVIENPPFGRVWNDSHTETVELDVDGFTTKEIDQAIVAKSLQALKDNGKSRAVLIIGGKQGGPEARKTKYRAASQVRFWGHLFDNYHILEHFSIDGKLYSRQGASYPIDVIVLDTNGTSAGRTYPGAELPRMYSSFEELEELFNEREMDRAGTSVSSDNAGAGVVQEGQGGESGGTSANPRVAPADASGTGRGRAGEAGGERASASGRREGNAEGTERPEHGARSGREGDSREGLGSDRRPSGRSGSAVGEADDNGGRGLPDSRGQARKTESGAVGEPDRLGEKHSGLEVAQKPNKQAPVQQKATEFQAPYKKTSSLPSMGTLVPKNMVTVVSNAMKALEKEHGKIDDYVSEELGYKPGELGNYFAAEQVDALGLAIHNLSKGAGFIIGDQTGIGKGRVNAGIIRWAKQHGKTPVFITCSNTLYGDMVRDLADIGMDGFTPLPTNPDLSGKDAIPLPDGRTLTTPGAAKHGALLAQVSEDGLGDYDAVFTTYKQLSSDPKGTRRRFLQNLAPNAVFILDESHNGGSANAGSDRFKKKNDNSESLAVFIRKLLNSCPNGTFYSSATYAKRPDLMDLYSKTDMRFAVNDIKALGEAIARGGIPMQQVVAAELTEAGQYIRRERTWEGADVETVSVKTDAARADASAEALRVIMEFDRAKQTKLKAIKDAEAGSGGTAYDNKSANEKAMQSASFSSVMHNLIAQGLLAQKVDAIVDAADAALKRGEKPVITLSNTMGAPIDDYAKNNAAKAGDPIDMTFKDMYLRYLDKARTVTKKDKNGNVIERRLLTDDELGPEALDLYNNARDIINESGLDALPLSIIDSIEHGLRQRGYKVGEITGRKMGIDYSGAQPVLASVDSSNKNKARVINEFNSGELDVVVLNAAGSTGISLHASENFKDQRRRTMIIAQPDLNIDTFMQTLGRIFRTGQVVPPKYQLLFTDIPAEKRPAAILAKKMASLNANTTAAKDSDASFKNIPDFMNKYGDRVAKQVMAENAELHERMGAPLDKEGVDGGDMQRLTGYIPLLPVKDQQKVYDLLESEYNELIAQHEAMGTLDLEAKTLPLDAKLIREEVVQPAKTDLSVSDSPFAAAAMIGEYDVKRLGHPFSSAKVKDFVRKAKPVDVDAEGKKMRAFVEKRLARIKDDERRDANRERLEGAFQAFNSIVRKFSVGDPVMVNNNREQQHIPGVIIGIYRDEKVENPLALSSWKMDVAIADAAKRIVFPFSQLSKETHEEDATTVEPYGVSLSEAYEAFDNGQSESRERVFIATGNILSAYERLHVGKVIQFEDHGGNIIPGLQMPRDTTLSALLDAVDMALTPEQSLRFLERLGSGKGAVKTEDKHFVLTRDDSGYNIAVPASKKDGAQYFLNGGILRAAGEDFVKSGQSMVLRGMDSKQTAAVLKVMADQGYGFVADNNKDMAREITGQRKSDEKPLASVAPSAHLPPVGKARRGMKADALRRVADKLGSIAKNAATARVVQSFDELPASIREAHKNARTTLEGVFDPRSGAVYLVADNLTSESRAAEVWAHEQVVHHGLRSILTPGERKRLMGNLFIRMGGMGNATIREVAQRYGLDPRKGADARQTVMEEVVASLAERKGKGLLKRADGGAWQRIVDAIKRAWHRLIEAVSGSPSAMNAANIDELLTALGRHVIDGAGNERGGRTAAAEPAYAARRGGDANNAAFSPDEGKKTDFVALPSGEIDFAQFPQTRLRDARLMRSAPIRLQRGVHSMSGGYGLEHIERNHGDEIRAAGYGSVQEFVWDLVNSFNEIWEGKQKSFLLLKNNSTNSRPAGFIELERDGAFYSVKNAYPVDKNYPTAATRKLLWKSAPPSSSTSGEQTPSNPFTPGIPLQGQAGNLQGQRGQSVEKRITPETGEDNTPLASIASSREAISDHVKGIISPEGIAETVRQLRKIAGRGVDEDVEELLNDPERGKLVEKSDLGLMERIFKLPHWIAKEFKEFQRLYERQQQRRDERTEATNKAIAQMPLLFDADSKKRLTEKEYAQLTEMLHRWDGKEIGPLHGIGKWKVKGQTLNGRDELEHNPRYQEKFREWLKTQPEPERVKQAFQQVRDALDNAFLQAYGKMAQMSDIADTDLEMYRTEFGNIHNYFPHNRKGRYYVRATEGRGVPGDPRRTVFRKHFDVPFGSSVREEWAKIVAANRKDFPGAHWDNPREVDKLPEDILGAPIDASAMEQIIKSAASKLGDGEQAQQIQKLMLSGVSDILKARGWGAHGIKRQDIAGYDKENTKETLYEYFSGLNGWLTKMEAAADFAQLLGKIDAQKQPRMWNYASQYVKDMLRNSDRVDRLAGNVKNMAFAWYLGGNLKTAVVNATQNIVDGVPRLDQYVMGATGRWVKAAADTIGIHYTGQGVKGARNLTKDEAAMLEDLYGNGIINAAYMDELQGQLTSSPVLKGWRKFMAMLGKPMAMVECFNRASLALAAYRAAKDGKWRPFARKELGLKPGEKMNNEDAAKFAAMLVRDSHFEYGKGNMPEYLRSNWTGRAISPIYTFRSFGANQLNLWYRALTKEGHAGRVFVAKSLGATIALGGLTSFPFFATLSAICAAVSGDDEDWNAKLRRTVLPKDDMAQNMILYGLPSLGGVTISGSLRMETPMTEGMEKGDTLKDVMDMTILGILGIPYDLVAKLSKANEALKHDSPYKAVETLVPTFAANMMQAYRLATEGQTTIKGKPIGNGEKLGLGEALGKALGFQPVSKAESYERYKAGKRADERLGEKRGELAKLLNEYYGKDTGKGMALVRRELKAWNEEMRAQGRESMVLTMKDVVKRAKRERTTRKPGKRQGMRDKEWMANTGS